MTASWGGHEEWSMKNRAAGDPPDSRDDPRVADKLAALAARHAPPRAQHVGRESYQTLAGRHGALQAAHADLADRHATLVAAQDQLLADMGALAAERDAWRARAADAERRADRAAAEDRDRRARWVGRLVGFAAILSLVVVAVYLIGG